MRICVIGAGVSGLVSAYLLSRRHDVTLIERESRLGGHTHTVDVDTPDAGRIPVDTGFIVFNRRNYPRFSSLLEDLGVESAPTSMSFSVRCERTGLEYGGRSLNGLLARRGNAISPRFWKMIRDIRRFGREAEAAARGRYDGATIGEYLRDARYSEWFAEKYLLPMSAAIWSTPLSEIGRFPLNHFVAFFGNHGMLEPWRAPAWRYVVGGSRRYIEALADRSALGTVLTGRAVRRVRRLPASVEVEIEGERERVFDRVVLAVHSDTALRLLERPTDEERAVLGAVPYRPNEVVLHTDASVLPARRAAWSSWNYLAGATEHAGGVGVTYYMNMLQRLPTRTPICVSLNMTERIDPAKVVRSFVYDHPQYSDAAFGAQRRWPEISGVGGVHFCGAYWGYGFHEDGVRSAVRVAGAIDADLAVRERVP